MRQKEVAEDAKSYERLLWDLADTRNSWRVPLHEERYCSATGAIVHTNAHLAEAWNDLAHLPFACHKSYYVWIAAKGGA